MLTFTVQIDDQEDGIEFQNIRARIKNTLNLPVDNLGKTRELQLTRRDMFVLKVNQKTTLLLSSSACWAGSSRSRAGVSRVLAQRPTENAIRVCQGR